MDFPSAGTHLTGYRTPEIISVPVEVFSVHVQSPDYPDNIEVDEVSETTALMKTTSR